MFEEDSLTCVHIRSDCCQSLPEKESSWKALIGFWTIWLFSNPPCWLVRGKFKRIQAVSRSDRRWWRRWRQPKLMGARPGWHEKGNWPKDTILPPGWQCHCDKWNLVTMRGSSQHQSQTLNLSHFFKDSDQESDLIRSQPVARYEVSLHSLRALVALCLNLRNGNDDG